MPACCKTSASPAPRPAAPNNPAAEPRRDRRRCIAAPRASTRRSRATWRGGYAYSLGYLGPAICTGLRRDSGDLLPLLADGSGDGGNSPNHGGTGQNVLYIGGHVRWCVNPTVGIDGDDIYLNRDRRVRAGVCRDDSVLGASDARPYPGE